MKLRKFEPGSFPDRFPPAIFRQKCDIVYQHFYDSYFGEGRSIYAGVGARVM